MFTLRFITGEVYARQFMDWVNFVIWMIIFSLAGMEVYTKKIADAFLYFCIPSHHLTKVVWGYLSVPFPFFQVGLFIFT